MAVEVGTENPLLSGRFVRTHKDLDICCVSLLHEIRQVHMHKWRYLYSVTQWEGLILVSRVSEVKIIFIFH